MVANYFPFDCDHLLRCISNGIPFNQPISICQGNKIQWSWSFLCHFQYYHSRHHRWLAFNSYVMHSGVRLRVAYLFGTSCGSNTLFRLSSRRIPHVFYLFGCGYFLSRDWYRCSYACVVALFEICSRSWIWFMQSIRFKCTFLRFKRNSLSIV